MSRRGRANADPRNCLAGFPLPFFAHKAAKKGRLTMSSAVSRDNTRFDTCPEGVRPYAVFVHEDGRIRIPWANVQTETH
jgi:hypothetical protein